MWFERQRRPFNFGSFWQVSCQGAIQCCIGARKPAGLHCIQYGVLGDWSFPNVLLGAAATKLRAQIRVDHTTWMQPNSHVPNPPSPQARVPTSTPTFTQFCPPFCPVPPPLPPRSAPLPPRSALYQTSRVGARAACCLRSQTGTRASGAASDCTACLWCLLIGKQCQWVSQNCSDGLLTEGWKVCWLGCIWLSQAWPGSTSSSYLNPSGFAMISTLRHWLSRVWNRMVHP